MEGDHEKVILAEARGGDRYQLIAWGIHWYYVDWTRLTESKIDSRETRRDLRLVEHQGPCHSSLEWSQQQGAYK